MKKVLTNGAVGIKLMSMSKTYTELYHVSGWGLLATAGIGDVFTLKPGPQGAEGQGVYFSEGAPVSATTAEGTHKSGIAAIVIIKVQSAAGWWRTKASLAKKFGRPRTWHSAGKNVECKVVSIEQRDGTRLLVCQGEVK